MIATPACRVMVIAATLAVPPAADAQAKAHASSSFSASQVYESNLFATPESLGPQADVISRFGPAFDAGYRSLPFEVAVSYEVLAERYGRHPELNENLARQGAAIVLQYRPNGRVSLSSDARYVATQTPAEFNRYSEIGVGRAPAERAAVRSAMSFNLNPATIISAEYNLERDFLVGGVASATHRPRAGVERRTGVRNAYHIDYERRQVAFNAETPATSHVITGGWEHEISLRTGWEVAIGPRFTDGSVRPEVSTRLRWRMETGELSIAYMRTELTAIGERGTIDVHSLSAGLVYRPTRRLTLTAAPSVSRSARDVRHAVVYATTVESTFDLRRWMSLVASGRIGRQEGTLAGPRHVIANRSVTLNLLIAPARNDRDIAHRRS